MSFSPKQLEATDAITKASKIKLETTTVEDSPYNPDFVKKIQNGRADVKNGKGTKIGIDDLWE
ncbi:MULTISPECIES: DUF2683 family protein [unclassified Sphingobacterium]|uniref:DUF2683 family protein n=1 Tax=unclassified Sphingobacterium TaxID=2609468 RepID=UPI0025DA6175|nr:MULTISPECIES: DUF2683 family protein [unclassified Sphingobacterium]